LLPEAVCRLSWVYEAFRLAFCLSFPPNDSCGERTGLAPALSAIVGDLGDVFPPLPFDFIDSMRLWSIELGAIGLAELLY